MSPIQRRRALWTALILLVMAMLAMLVWLAGDYEMTQVQNRLERDAAQAGTDVQTTLAANVQGMQALQYADPTPNSWAIDAATFLREHREIARLEWRDTDMTLLAYVESPFRAPIFERDSRSDFQAEVLGACVAARRFGAASYAPGYFVPLSDGLGVHLMELCLPLQRAGKSNGYLVASYLLQELLDRLRQVPTLRNVDAAFTEGDGTRLALYHAPRHGNRLFSAQQLLDLPGITMLLRVESWRGTPDLFPNVLTALVAGMCLALVTVLLLLGQDIRLRFKAENDLAESLAFRKAMEDSLLTGLRARDMDGRVTYVNPAFGKMLGFSVDELLESAIPPPYWPPECVEDYLRMQQTRKAGNLPPREGFESLFMRKDGSRFPVLIVEAPLINANGVQAGWMSAVLDISEQRRVEEVSRASQERLQASARLATVGEMASLLSHELNQPLTAISGYAAGSINLLDAEHVNAGLRQADLRLAMQRIAEQAERAGKVIRSVHDFVRRRDQVRAAVAPSVLVEAVLPLVHLQARKLSVQVIVTLEEGLPDVVCDRTMVEQVLLNLARNAMQAMDSPSVQERELQMRARLIKRPSHKPWLEFSVADVGTGIAPEIQGSLFNPFFTTRAEGMGLGLSLCRTVVEQHGGALVFENRVPRGTVFIFTLPVAGLE